jgi:hypothetical protein
MGLKLAYKGYQAYNDCKAELEEFADDYDELNMRLQAMQPVLDGLAGRLDDSLSLTLELAKSEQEKANKYTEELLQYTRKFKGHAPHFNTIVTALAAKAVGSLPGPLQQVGEAMLPIIKKHGVPEKAYAKFADKLHFLISALSAAASVQLVKSMTPGATMDRGTGVEMKANPSTSTSTYASVPSSDGAAPVVVVADPVPAADHSALLAGTAAALPDSDSSAKLKAILEENIEENDADFRAIVIGTRMAPYTIVFGLWLEKKPHILTVTFFGVAPASMRITTAPSTDYILALQKDPQRVKSNLGEVRKECKATPGSLDMRKNHDVILMGFVPYLGSLCNLAAVYCNCLFTRLNLDDVPINSNKYRININNKVISINGNVVFEPTNLPVNMGAMAATCCCPCIMWPEMCC